MNILFNKKILFSLLLSSSLLIQGAYAQEGGSSSNIYGEYNITTGSSHSTPELQVYSNGSVNVGNTTLSDGTGVLYIADETNNTGDNPHSTVSNIQKNLTVNIDGNFLNEETMNCNGSNDNEANRAKVKNNKGLFINQGNINVGQYATLTCGKFPGNDNTNEYDSSWYKDNAFITNHNNYGGIMNGNNSFVTNIPTFTYNSNIIGVDSNPVPSKQGTITFIPGAVCNDGIVPDGGTQGVSEGPGEIDGGTIDLTQYVQIKSSSTGNTHTDGTNTLSLQFDTNSDLNKAKNNLKIKLKNAEIKLFDGKVKNSNNPQQEITDKLELSELKLEALDTSGNGNFLMNNMFENLTFENCRCQIPDDSGSGAATYKAQKGTETPISTLDASNLKGHNGSAETTNSLIIFNSPYRYKIITDGSSSGSNFDIVKKLFANISSIAESTNDNNSTHKKIYHELGERNTTTGNKYKVWINNGSTDGIDNDVSDDPISQPEDGLVLWSTNGGGAGNKSTFSELFNEYMNLNCYIDTADTTKAYSNDDASPLPLKLKPTSTNGDTISSNIFIQTSGSTPIQIDEMYTDGNNDESIDKPLELVMKNPWIHTKLGDSEPDKITYNGTLSRKLPSSPSDDQRTTKIVQEYDGPAFNKYSVTISGTDTSTYGSSNIDNTNKSKCTTSEILEYAVEKGGTCFSAENNFGGNKPFVADKFTIGNGSDTIEVNSSSSSKTSNILTQNFTVNDKATYTLTGHISVKNLKAGDFNA